MESPEIMQLQMILNTQLKHLLIFGIGPLLVEAVVFGTDNLK
jgi:hypothetical protein